MQIRSSPASKPDPIPGGAPSGKPLLETFSLLLALGDASGHTPSKRECCDVP